MMGSDETMASDEIGGQNLGYDSNVFPFLSKKFLTYVNYVLAYLHGFKEMEHWKLST